MPGISLSACTEALTAGPAPTPGRRLKWKAIARLNALLPTNLSPFFHPPLVHGRQPMA